MAEARSECDYESLFLPGLLQTEEYARAVVSGVVTWADRDQVDRYVQARMRRQALLTQVDPLRLWAIVDEAALRRVVGGRSVMRDQVRHLLDQLELPHVTMQVIPFDRGAHPGMPGSFVHLEFPERLDPDLIYRVSRGPGRLVRWLQRPPRAHDLKHWTVTHTMLDLKSHQTCVSVQCRRS